MIYTQKMIFLQVKFTSIFCVYMHYFTLSVFTFGAGAKFAASSYSHFQLQDCHSQLQKNKTKLALTENQLVEKNAEVDMKNNEICTLSKELSVAKEKLSNAQEELKECKELFTSFKKNFDVVSTKVSLNFRNVENSLMTFKAFDSRLSFASKRLQMIQGWFCTNVSLDCHFSTEHKRLPSFPFDTQMFGKAKFSDNFFQEIFA